MLEYTLTRRVEMSTERIYQDWPPLDVNDHYATRGTGWCKQCGMPCAIKTVDIGIGPYEYAGAPGVDTHLIPASVCCEGEVADSPTDVPFDAWKAAVLCMSPGPIPWDMDQMEYYHDQGYSPEELLEMSR